MVDRQRAAVVFAGLGAGLLALGEKPASSLIVTVLFVAAFAAVRVLTDGRTPGIVLAAPPIAWAFGGIWTFFHKDTPFLISWLSNVGDFLMLAAIFATVMAAAPKIGSGLAWAIGSAMLLRVGADSMMRVLANAHGMNREAASSVHDVLHALSLVGLVGRRLAPIAWILLALGPVDIPPIRSRTLAVLGAFGAGICFMFQNNLLDPNDRHHFASVNVFFFVVGWLLVIAGCLAVALSTAKGIAWFGFVLAILQLIVGPIMVLALDANDARIPLVMSFALAAMALALTAFSGGLGLRRFRLGAGVLFSIAALGAAIESVAVVAGSLRLIRLEGAPADYWCADLARFGLENGLLVWCGTLLVLAVPPLPARA